MDRVRFAACGLVPYSSHGKIVQAIMADSIVNVIKTTTVGAESSWLPLTSMCATTTLSVSVELVRDRQPAGYARWHAVT